MKTRYHAVYSEHRVNTRAANTINTARIGRVKRLVRRPVAPHHLAYREKLPRRFRGVLVRRDLLLALSPARSTATAPDDGSDGPATHFGTWLSLKGG